MKAKTKTSKCRILIVDDDAGVVDFLTERLSKEGYLTTGMTSSLQALELIKTSDFDLVIADIEMPEMRGLELLSAVQAVKPSQLVMFITAFGSIELAVKASRAGACDFITKPFKIEVILLAIERAFRERQMRREIVRLRSTLPQPDQDDFVARSPSALRVLEIARRAAGIDSSVLITGESGVGKGTVARYIHKQSPRRNGPFIQVDCTSLPAPLVESELFGVRKGAYTDAREDRPGLFVQADGGTVFLDEIAELPLESQSKLLQATETGKIRPVGGTGEVHVNVRVIAATNNPLEDALQQHRFRQDLYYRLNVIRIEIPPLRERPEDIEVLVDLFFQRACSKLGRSILGITLPALQWLLSYRWPGNVRELANMIERAVALTEHDSLTLEDLCPPGTSPPEGDFLADAARRGLAIDDVVQAYIRKVIELNDGNKTQAAKILGIDRSTLYRKLGVPEDGTEE